MISFSYDICAWDTCLGNELYKGISVALTGENTNVKTITKKDIVKNYCTVIYSFWEKYYKYQSKGASWNDGMGPNIMWYKTNDSIFLAALCASVWIDKVGDLQIEWANIKKDFFEYYQNLQKFSKAKSGECIKTKWILVDDQSLNNVDYSCVSKKAFDAVASDMINIATYVSYWAYEDEQTRKKWEKDFFTGEDSPCKDSYIASENKDEWYCYHPETLKQIESQNQKLITMIKNLNTIELPNPDSVYSIFWTWWILLSVKKRAYTELYYYGLFSTYYATALKIFNTTLANKESTSDAQKIINLNWQGEILNTNKNFSVARLSLYKSFDIVKNIYSLYPVHLAYLMITEDLIRLRKSLARLYTPLDQLRYKLEQAQDEDN